LDKLAKTEATVDVLSREATVQRAALREAQVGVDAAMTRIEAAMQETAARKAEVERLSAQLDNEQRDIEVRKVRYRGGRVLQRKAVRNAVTSRGWTEAAGGVSVCLERGKVRRF